MALVQETGAGVAGANTFVLLPYADTYPAARGNAPWAAATSAARETALVRAGDYLNCLAWKGQKLSAGQAMAWPRYDAWDGDGWEIGFCGTVTALLARSFDCFRHCCDAYLSST